MNLLFSKEEEFEEITVFEIPPVGKDYKTTEDIYDLCQTVKMNSQSITEIILGHNTYSDDVMEELAEAIQECSNITIANLSSIFREWDDFYTPKILDTLSRTLLGFRELEELDLSNNFLTVQAVDIVGFLLENTPTLKILRIDNNRLGAEGGVKLAESLKNSAELKLFVFSAENTKLEDAGIVSLSEVFGEMQSLREICVSKNDIKKQGIIALSKALVKNDELQILRIADNFISDPAAFSKLHGALKNLRFLSIIDVADCCLGNKGVGCLLDSLHPSENLLELHLEYNDLDDTQIGEILVNFILSKRYLEVLNLAGSNFDEETIEKIRKAAGKFDKELRIIIEENESKNDSFFDSCLDINENSLHHDFMYIC
ncbi:RNA1_3 [Blepharisma stoltei]|uniref:Ran GTPase-activating protein n=1 Tax=Blepharisma stoltei TaxID=1481888 RepID=A0AAU9JDY3_9CILI|nr:unnamed protein product [Blepharisma stoltei]